jgi:hypothetical protein
MLKRVHPIAAECSGQVATGTAYLSYIRGGVSEELRLPCKADKGGLTSIDC